MRQLLAIAMALFALGCGDRSARYTPSAATADAAVRSALDAWQQGQPPGAVPDTQPAVQMIDAGRKPGQTLSSYRILGETRGPSGRTFAVVLRLASPEEEIKTQYIVVGIDPLWVFRQEDYGLLAHWDHHMPPEQPTVPDGEASR
jgi:hypothetical protein